MIGDMRQRGENRNHGNDGELLGIFSTIWESFNLDEIHLINAICVFRYHVEGLTLAWIITGDAKQTRPFVDSWSIPEGAGGRHHHGP